MSENPFKKLAVVMAKEPVPGKVKTRLTPPLTPREAADVYRCFLQDRLLAMGALSEVDIALAYTPSRALKPFIDFCPENFGLFAQHGRTLGEKLCHIFQEKLSEGYDAVSVTGSDSPDLPNRLIRTSFDRLLVQGADLVLGPCPDGGYYLIAATKLYPELFSGIPWSTDKVLAATLKKAAALGLKTELLPPWRDLDTFQDLVLYHQNCLRRKRDANGPGKITYSFLINLLKLQQR
ncbi:MAG: TIGR04282 family arsenosugar biosynthesis glycosyltransferase [Desulfobacterales bacterium]|nr:TIGR04282 family arsenosugar biosynthesis glycosyltransferase [Desulfobacterales bacterium]